MKNLTTSCSYLSSLVTSSSDFFKHLHNLPSLIFDYACVIITTLFSSLEKHHNHDHDHNHDELQVRRYTSKIRGYDNGQNVLECAICLSKVEERNEIRELRCDHIFHKGCLDRWMGYRHRTCPLCRDSLSPPSTIVSKLDNVIFFKFCALDDSDSERWWLR